VETTTPEMIAEAAANWINGLGDDVHGPDSVTPIYFSAESGQYSSVAKAEVVDGALILIGHPGESFYVGMSETSYVVDNGQVVIELDDEDMVDVTDDYVHTIVEARDAIVSNDVLEGGEGNDVYVIVGSQYESMDTIVGMDFGGVGNDEGADRIVLGAPAAMELAWGVVNGETLPVGEDLLIVNGGLVDHNSLNDDLDLETALEALFQGAGVFDAEGSSDTRTYAAGLFSHQGETYLIAVGGQAESKFGADDYIVKLENFSGTLDSSDLLMWSNVLPG